jgi:hypothetical protein
MFDAQTSELANGGWAGVKTLMSGRAAMGAELRSV